MKGLAVNLAAADPADNIRVSNLDSTFRISEFWSRHIEDELQFIGSQVSAQFREDGIEPTEENVRKKLRILARDKKLEIGRRGLAICNHAVYFFAANTDSVVSDIVRSCEEDSIKQTNDSSGQNDRAEEDGTTELADQSLSTADQLTCNN
jgi:hypothetical protein